MQTFRKHKGKEQHIINLAANNDIELIEVSPIPATHKPPHEPTPTPSSLSPDLLSATNITPFHLEYKLLPKEDFSATGLDKKRRLIKNAAVHSWRAYEEHAWGFDELQPITQDGKETLGGIGATIVDSLDTLWLMGLKDDFSR